MCDCQSDLLGEILNKLAGKTYRFPGYCDGNCPRTFHSPNWWSNKLKAQVCLSRAMSPSNWRVQLHQKDNQCDPFSLWLEFWFVLCVGRQYISGALYFPLTVRSLTWLKFQDGFYLQVCNLLYFLLYSVTDLPVIDLRLSMRFSTRFSTRFSMRLSARHSFPFLKI